MPINSAIKVVLTTEKGGTEKRAGCIGQIVAVIAVLLTAVGLILTYVYVLDRPDLAISKAIAIQLQGPLVEVVLTINNQGKAGAKNVQIVARDAADSRAFVPPIDVPDIPANGASDKKVLSTGNLAVPPKVGTK